MTSHPAPRIEIVYAAVERARVIPGDLAGIDRMGCQPWHVRHVAANGETTSTSEQLTGLDAAIVNVLADAHLFAWPDADLVSLGSMHGNMSADDDGAHLWNLHLDPALIGSSGTRFVVPVLLRVES